MRANNRLMLRVAEGQQGLEPILARIADNQAAGAIDEETRAHIRNLDLHIARMADDIATGRAQSTNDLRNEIKVLTRTIAAIAGDQQR